jgi:hypothetical protein
VSSRKNGVATKLIYSNVTFYIGDIAKAEDVSNAIRKVSHGSSAHAGRAVHE